MKATLLVRRRVFRSDRSFVEMVVWNVPAPVRGSTHSYKYRLAYVVDGICVLRYDNEAGKGDHKHVAEIEFSYRFTTIDRLVADFLADVERLEE